MPNWSFMLASSTGWVGEGCRCHAEVFAELALQAEGSVVMPLEPPHAASRAVASTDQLFKISVRQLKILIEFEFPRMQNSKSCAMIAHIGRIVRNYDHRSIRALFE